jgi:hypothetical protein
MPLRWWVVAARSVHVSSSAEPEASKTWRDRGELPMDVHPQHCRKLGRLSSARGVSCFWGSRSVECDGFWVRFTESSEYKRQHSDHGSRRQKRVVDKLSTKMTQARGREDLVVIHSRRARLSTHRVLVWLFGSWDGWAI